MAGMFGKLLKGGATAAGTALGGPVGGAIGAGLGGIGDSLVQGNDPGTAIASGAMQGIDQGLTPKTPGVSHTSLPSASIPSFSGVHSPTDLTMDPSLSPPSLLDVLKSRQQY